VTQTSPRTTFSTAWRSPVASYYLLMASTGILLLVGLAVVLSSTSILSIRQRDGNAWTLFLIQVVALAVGTVALAILSRFSVKGLKRVAPFVLFGSAVLLVLVYLRGVSVGGNKNWLPIGPITVQPSEIAKLGLALYLGVVLAMFRHELTTMRRILVPGGIVAGVILVLVLAGRDMGTAVVLSLVIAAAYWVAGLPLRFFALGAAGLVVGALALIADGSTRSARINVWLNPATCDVQGDCLQTTHGTWALASGGLWGLGPGMSREKWGYLPAADNDFIFAILGEEWGLIGTLLVLLAFTLMAIAVHRIVRRHRDPFAQIVAGSIGAWIVGQAFINIAVVLELLPVTGVPLPLVSSGGSSLIMSLAGIGVLMALARTEPGAREAFNARPSVMRRYLAVMARSHHG
jgi:cell division protein FtsW